MARLIGIDYGKKRTGIAVSDIHQIIANGLTTVDSTKTINFLKNYIEKEPVGEIIVGLPKQMNNMPSENMARVDDFVQKLKATFPALPIRYFDERFSSKMAFQTMIDSGLKKKARQNKALVDEISATIILQGYMESRRSEQPL